MRRFSDFLGLHDILVEKYLRSGRIIPPAPQKNIIGTTKVKMSSSSQSQTEPGVGIGMEWVENRRAALERFLSRTAQHPVLCVDPEFVNFLQSDEELPRSVNTATLSGAGVMRLFNKVGETVNKITYKMDENDPVNFHSFLIMPKFDVFFSIAGVSGSKTKSTRWKIWTRICRNCIRPLRRWLCIAKSCPRWPDVLPNRQQCLAHAKNTLDFHGLSLNWPMLR